MARHSEHRGGPAGRRVAFTLVELLVVVGVIALLVAILVPSLTSARAQARSALCRANLKQIHGMLLAPEPGAPMALPAPRNWIARVNARGGGRVLRCLEDNEPRSDETVLADIWIEHMGHGGMVQPNYLSEILYHDKNHNTEPNAYHQVHLFEIDPGHVFEIRYVYPPDIGRDGAHSILQIVFEPEIILLVSLNPEDFGYGLSGCISDCVVWRGPGKSEQLLQLTGVQYQKIDPRSPVKLPRLETSYGYNDQVPPIGGPASQIMALDYLHTIVDLDAHRGDWSTVIDGRREYNHLAPRHRGRANVLYVDGHVQGAWPEALAPDDDAWKP